MKCTIPEISWHNREPVLSVDIYPENEKFYRLASGGGDCHVLIWQMHIAPNGAVNQEVISDLTRHQRAVNCVRWSNSGKYLASGDDDANIIIWQLKTDNIPLLEGDTGDKETWIVYKIMRGHKEDVYDICWSIDGSKILSGSVDNTAILWDVNKGQMDHILSDHKGFVQGVAWDPKNQVIATISTDRTCRIFNTLGTEVKARIHKGKLTSVPDDHLLKNKDAKYFHDDTFKSFFRRLQFTPDGSLLIVPSGHIEVDNCKTVFNATLIFALDDLNSPAVILPIPRQSSTVVRCCPLLYELRERGPEPIIKLPYRMIFAVGTDHDIILYDTQQTLPFARFQDIHYTRLTDLTWSQDGLLLVASSTDGFCSLITFDLDELGIPWVKVESDVEDNPLEISGCAELIDKCESDNINSNNTGANSASVTTVKPELKEQSKKRPSLLEQWALKTPKKRKLDESCKNPSKEDTNVVEILDSPEKNNSDKQDSQKTVVEKTEEKINKLIPRRTASTKVENSNESVKNEISKGSVENVDILTPKRIKPILIESRSSQTGISDASTIKRSKQNEEISENISDNEDEETSDSDEELNPEERLQYNKASQNIQEFFSRQTNKLETKSKTIDAPKEKINILIPKRVRVQPATMESKPSTVKVTNEKCCNSSESLSSEELKEFHNASEHIKEFFYRPPKNSSNSSNSDANPIAIRKKPKENVTKPNTTLLTNIHSDAKPIAVKRKPIQTELNESEEQLKNTVNSDDLIKDDAKPIADSRKPEESKLKQNEVDIKASNKTDRSVNNLENCVSEDASGSIVEDNTNKLVPNKLKKYSELESKNPKRGESSAMKSVKTKKNKNINKESQLSSSKIIEADVICLEDSDNDKSNTDSSKKDSGPPKIKVSSLVKRKSTKMTTPQKPRNALLNFLQKSSEKKTKKNEEKDCSVNIDLEEVGARDAWSCEAKQCAEQNVHAEEENKVIHVDDDETEDFCLQLEDSQQACVEKETISLSQILDKDKIESEEKNKSVEEKSTPKTPKRIPLITVASPSNKTKRKL